MCGVLGVVSRREPIDPTAFARMRDALAHRGPDDAASEFFEAGRIALGHRRLAFLDLSEAGRQPLANEDRRVWIVLNGEIYNYLELRVELQALGHRFRSSSDTEVLVHGYEQWGTGLVDRLKGMFAFGVLDLEARTLWLVRDRFGIKPLYVRRTADRLHFASELKAIVADPLVRVEPDVSAIADYLVYRYVPSPRTIWQGIRKVPPAHWVQVDLETLATTTREYWRPRFGTEPEVPEELARETGQRLAASVALHARSDVPIGAFLSGGYDSSAVVGLMAEAGYRPETFSIGFDGWPESEHQYAEVVARQFGVPFHHELANGDTLDLLERMPEVYDEPIADISILPTWMVSRLAARSVKAVMSGEGADELFVGYWWQKTIATPGPRPPWYRRWLSREAPASADLVPYYADAMAMGRFDRPELQRAFTEAHHDRLPSDPDWFYRQHHDPALSPLKRIQRLDIKCFMAELVLTKIDRASMAHSLEVRVPFLDHELFDRILGVRESSYFRPAVTKYLLHENLKDRLPRAILDRPKQGFVGPDEFLKVMERYDALLSDGCLVGRGLIRPEYIAGRLAESDQWRLWKLAVLEHWCRRWLP